MTIVKDSSSIASRSSSINRATNPHLYPATKSIQRPSLQFSTAYSPQTGRNISCYPHRMHVVIISRSDLSCSSEAVMRRAGSTPSRKARRVRGPSSSSVVTWVMRARFLTRPQLSPSGVSAGHSMPHWLGCRALGPLTYSVALMFWDRVRLYTPLGSTVKNIRALGSRSGCGTAGTANTARFWSRCGISMNPVYAQICQAPSCVA